MSAVIVYEQILKKECLLVQDLGTIELLFTEPRTGSLVTPQRYTLSSATHGETNGMSAVVDSLLWKAASSSHEILG